jgi:UDP-glucuronate 4-epimerase
MLYNAEHWHSAYLRPGIKMMNQTVLVTGVEGMIGYAVAKRLRDKGWSVVGMDQRLESARTLGVPVYKAELRDTHAIYGVLREHPCDAIIHCGAISGPMLVRDNPILVFESNTLGTLNLLEAARRLQVKRFVFASSLMVYGANDGSPLREESPLVALEAYGASKIAAEAMVGAYTAQHGLDAVSARLAWVYGPRRQTACAIRMMLQNALSGEPTVLPSGRSALRQYVHVDDVAAALITLLEATSLPRRVYNVAGGDYRPFTKIVDIVREIAPGAHVEVGDAPDPDDPFMGPLSIAAIAQDLGWAPSIPLRDGIVTYRDWLARLGAP